MIRLDAGWRLEVADPGLSRARRRLAAFAAAMLLAVGLGFLIAPRAAPPAPGQLAVTGRAIPNSANNL